MDIRIIPITFILSDHGYMIVVIVIAVLSSGFMDMIVMDVIIIKTIMAVAMIVDNGRGHCRPPQLRIHLCWGNWHGPHHHDIPIEKIFKVA